MLEATPMSTNDSSSCDRPLQIAKDEQETSELHQDKVNHKRNEQFESAEFTKTVNAVKIYQLPQMLLSSLF